MWPLGKWQFGTRCFTSSMVQCWRRSRTAPSLLSSKSICLILAVLLRFRQSCWEGDEVVYVFGLKRVKERTPWWGGGQPGLHQISYIKINCLLTALQQSLNSWCGSVDNSQVRFLTGMLGPREWAPPRGASSHVWSWQQECCHGMPWDTSSWWLKTGSWPWKLLVHRTEEFSSLENQAWGGEGRCTAGSRSKVALCHVLGTGRYCWVPQCKYIFRTSNSSISRGATLLPIESA